MNLEDLAKKTIDEVHHQIKEQERQLQSLKEQEEEHQKADEAKIEVLEDDHLKTSQEDILEQIQMAKFQEEQENLEISEQDETKKEPIEESEILNPNIIAKVQSLNEDIFLKNLKERILVLFEGLNDTKKEDLDARLELTINFLEFLLANIEDRLNK
ncbi:2-oxoglutarate:acceptor oxidoreductase [Campylobacter felis]|uniref:effector protein CiaD n=1 Tax=Campylobacter felis TaxID=2974565 RepID=UPI00256E93D3|nr:2-oxoglutarate:acceptor oxidoreductase [Campylobacter felis]